MTLVTPQACALCGATDEPGEGWQCETGGCTDRLCGFCGKEFGRCSQHISAPAVRHIGNEIAACRLAANGGASRRGFSDSQCRRAAFLALAYLRDVRHIMLACGESAESASHPAAMRSARIRGLLRRFPERRPLSMSGHAGIALYLAADMVRRAGVLGAERSVFSVAQMLLVWSIESRTEPAFPQHRAGSWREANRLAQRIGQRLLFGHTLSPNTGRLLHAGGCP